ncbi:MAG: prohibitin family protein [Cytophagales bacterium]|nr:prohibitin family protein [Cytophagales bacterium]
MENKGLVRIVVIGVIGLIVLIFFSSSMFITIEPGERGVIFRKFTTGLDKEHIFQPGFTVIAPWNRMFLYQVKDQIKEETVDVLDKNGLSLHIDVTVRFYPVYNKIGELQEKFQGQYIDVVVVPEARSSVRRVMGRYTAEEIYSTKRAEVEKTIIEETEKVLSANHVVMKSLLLRSITLPPQIKQAIEDKLQKEQELLAYEFKLKTARKEAEKRIIDAKGKAQSNRILSASLTDKILKEKGIIATQELASSPNTKVIVIGSGKDGLPLILGGN